VITVMVLGLLCLRLNCKTMLFLAPFDVFLHLGCNLHSSGVLTLRPMQEVSSAPERVG
jgi:hypothetical protein